MDKGSFDPRYYGLFGLSIGIAFDYFVFGIIYYFVAYKNLTPWAFALIVLFPIIGLVAGEILNHTKSGRRKNTANN